MRVVSLASGSKGNCLYIETNNTKILIDAGISFLAINTALLKLGTSTSDIDAIIISHEHSDHTKGLSTFVNKHKNISIYISRKSAEVLSKKIPNFKFEIFENIFEYNDIIIKPVQLPHDSVDCYGFVIKNERSSMGIFTDIGHMNSFILSQMKGLPLIYLESNYDEELLFNCNYPEMLKQRISSKNGHLSNVECAKTIEELVKSGTKQIVLSHISENSNSPEVAYFTSKNYLYSKGIVEGVNIRIDVALAKGPSTIFRL